ncbi:MAG TPA: hypothetical protein VGS09_09710 [Actinomycetota bacterium]|nr:hypothetical protein [Actinomycetota bacterium]
MLIDTLSFERLREGQPWVAYRQFCQHFLGPLAPMSHREGFKHAFGERFEILRRESVRESERVLHLMRRGNG